MHVTVARPESRRCCAYCTSIYVAVTPQHPGVRFEGTLGSRTCGRAQGRMRLLGRRRIRQRFCAYRPLVGNGVGRHWVVCGFFTTCSQRLRWPSWRRTPARRRRGVACITNRSVCSSGSTNGTRREVKPSTRRCMPHGCMFGHGRRLGPKGGPCFVPGAPLGPTAALRCAACRPICAPARCALPRGRTNRWSCRRGGNASVVGGAWPLGGLAGNAARCRSSGRTVGVAPRWKLHFIPRSVNSTAVGLSTRRGRGVPARLGFRAWRERLVMRPDGPQAHLALDRYPCDATGRWPAQVASTVRAGLYAAPDWVRARMAAVGGPGPDGREGRLRAPARFP